MPRLDENQDVLIETYDLVTAAAEQNHRIEPAAEWLLDNFYLVEEQIRSIRRLLPPSYSRELPRLASGAASGYPRVYGIALELIAHVDGRVEPHTGRGGWTWYTGSAGWMYRLIVESLIGLHLEVDKLRFSPRLPTSWTEFQIHYRYRQTFYHITVCRSAEGREQRLTLDEVELAEDFITVVDDGRDHRVVVEMESSTIDARH